MKKYILSTLMLFVVLAMSAIPQKPKQERLVNDFASVLTQNEQRSLEQKLVRFDSETSTQIALVTVKDLEGLPAIEMATRIMEKWGVGGSKDNGIVIVFKPKTASSKGQIAVATGYGLEHLVTDALAKKVVEYDFIPSFKTDNLYGGFDKGTSVLMALTKKEYTGAQYLEKKKRSGSSGGFVFIFFIIFYIFSRIGRRRSMGQFSSHGSSLPFWLLMGMSSGSRGGSSFGNFSSGGGSFGGFGGGMGGGGGAGGSW